MLKQKWVVKSTGEIGDDADVYYLNVETGLHHGINRKILEMTRRQSIWESNSIWRRTWNQSRGFSFYGFEASKDRNDDSETRQ